MTFYCPACGEQSELDYEIILQPTPEPIEVECPVCTVKFEVEIRFYPPKEDEEE